MKQHSVRLAMLPLLVWAGCVGASKSSTPLSPAIAGPIAGVGISAPSVVAPAIDAMIDANAQPITLQVGNAETNGVRPLTYRFEIAADPNFTSPVFNKEAVPQDPSGRTSMTLPGPLSPERKYYWHARAEDGANTGPFGATSAFNVFTPVVLGPPSLLSPINGSNAGTLQPRFVIGNAGRSGPVGWSCWNELAARIAAPFRPAWCRPARCRRRGRTPWCCRRRRRSFRSAPKPARSRRAAAGPTRGGPRSPSQPQRARRGWPAAVSQASVRGAGRPPAPGRRRLGAGHRRRDHRGRLAAAGPVAVAHP